MASSCQWFWFPCCGPCYLGIFVPFSPSKRNRMIGRHRPRSEVEDGDDSLLLKERREKVLSFGEDINLIDLAGQARARASLLFSAPVGSPLDSNGGRWHWP